MLAGRCCTNLSHKQTLNSELTVDTAAGHDPSDVGQLSLIGHHRDCHSVCARRGIINAFLAAL
jgi:hypothetical protein